MLLALTHAAPSTTRTVSVASEAAAAGWVARIHPTGAHVSAGARPFGRTAYSVRRSGASLHFVQDTVRPIETRLEVVTKAEQELLRDLIAVGVLREA
jgi:hypothetical protein